MAVSVETFVHERVDRLFARPSVAFFFAKAGFLPMCFARPAVTVEFVHAATTLTFVKEATQDGT